MRTKSYHKLPNLIFLLVFLLSSDCTLEALAVMKDDQGRPDQAHSSPSSPMPTPAASHQWGSFLWEALPSEWLRDPKMSAVLEAYQQRDWKPLFITPRFELSPDGRSLLERLEHLESDAIDAKPYQLEALGKSIHQLDQTRMALQAVDPKFHDSLATSGEAPSNEPPQASGSPGHLAQNSMNSNQTAPSEDPSLKRNREQKIREAFRAASNVDVKLTQDFMLLAREFNFTSTEPQVKALTGEIPMARFLKQLEPTSSDYASLLKARAKYRQLSGQGQQSYNDKVPLRPGETGNAVRVLQKRLQQEGFYEGKVTGVYDTETQQAVQQFQRFHLLDGDGTVGQRTKEWLNVTYAQKAKMITQSLRAMRQSQTRGYDRFVRINIPQFMLEYYKDGKVQEVHRVIVGKAVGKKVKAQGRIMGENQTPVLSSFIEQVIFNPRWYISDRIRRELGAIGEDPSFFAKHGYVQMSSQYPWGDPRLFQMPGPTNPLGRVKFEFSNAYAVFLHDTPKKQLFNRARRDFSHGCIRVEGALDLARRILTDDQNPAAEKTASYLQINRQTHVKLQQPVPLVIEYIPVVTNEHGQLLFCGDLYGWFEEERQKS